MLRKKKKLAAIASKEQPAVKYDTITTVDGTYHTIVPDSYKNKGWHRPDPRQIFSFIPGTITEISVKVGDTVKIGDKLLMFNAMKMNNTLCAAQDGTIAAVHVAVGEIVPEV